MNIAQALWITNVESVELREEILPTISSDQVEIKCSYSTISIGTERLVFSGSVPKKLHNVMNVPYQQGKFSFPIKYGYSLVGTVVESKNSELIGRNAQLLHPHQNKTVVNVQDLFLLPETIRLDHAAHLSNLETAINAIWDAQILLGEKILLVGFGTIGSLVGLILKSVDMIELVVTDVDLNKLQKASNLGFETITLTELSEQLDNFDLSIHCSGTGTGLQTAIDAIGFESRCIDVSWYGVKDVMLKLGESFHPMRKKILASQVSNVPSHLQNRWNTDRRKEFALKIISKLASVEKYQKVIPFSNIIEEYPKVLNNENKSIQTLIKY